jgi:hypothetical protein
LIGIKRLGATQVKDFLRVMQLEPCRSYFSGEFFRDESASFVQSNRNPLPIAI